jgi:hypothetical protein
MKKDFHKIGTKSFTEKNWVEGESQSRWMYYFRFLVSMCVFIIINLYLFAMNVAFLKHLQKKEFESYRNGDLSIVSSESDPVSFL